MAADADVLVLGAGPGGCATALALSRAGVDGVVLVDRPVGSRFRIGESATPDVGAMLERLGLSRDLGALGHRPYHANLSLWGGPEPVTDDFIRRGQGHGWHLDRAAFDAWLRAEAAAAGARLETAALAAVAPGGSGWRVDLSDGRSLSARIVVDAAGRRSPLATRLGARRHKIDSLVALAVTADCDPALAGRALVEPFADGWWYAARLPGGRAVVTLMTDAATARGHGLRDPAAFAAAWERTDRLSVLVPPVRPERVMSFAAHSGFVDRAAGPGWIAVGDALIGFDPLTSSGIAGALGDGLSAADVIRAWLDGAPPAEAARPYVARAEATIRHYLAERLRHYRAETRWPDRPFWRVRH